MSDIVLGKKTLSRQAAGVVGKTILYFILVLFALMTIYPLVWMLLGSFRSNIDIVKDPMGLPTDWTLANYIGAWKIGKFGDLFLNSVLYTALTIGLALILSTMAGFAFAKLRSRAKNALYASFVIGILLSVQSLMVPLFMTINAVGLYNSYLGVLLPYIGLALPLGVYLITEYIKSIPDSLIESARIEGASFFQIFWRIVLPMVKPVAITYTVLTISNVWNEFMLINVLVSDDNLKTLPVGILKFSGSMASDYGKQFAALVIGAIPMVLYFFFFRKQITQGVSAGAVKE